MLKSLPLDLKRIAEATATNEGLKAVIEAVDNSWSTLLVRKLAPYYGMRDQLLVKCCSQGSESDVLLKGGMVVIPECLVQDFLLQVHSGHLGCSKMKALVQSCAYWPGFSKDIDEFVRRCQACTVYQTKTDRAPLQSVASTVKEPSHTIAIDLTGPNDEALKGNTLLTIIDMHTRYPEVYVLRRATATEIIECLWHSFSTFGLPQKVVSDNGPQFISQEFEAFLKEFNIDHIKSSNYFPSSNGCIERFHSTLKAQLKRVFFDSNVKFEVALDKVLFDIRKTPNAMTGVTPFQAMFNQPMRTDLSALTEVQTKVTSGPRNIAKEYARPKSRIVQYQAGD